MLSSPLAVLEARLEGTTLTAMCFCKVPADGTFVCCSEAAWESGRGVYHRPYLGCPHEERIRTTYTACRPCAAAKGLRPCACADRPYVFSDYTAHPPLIRLL